MQNYKALAFTVYEIGVGTKRLGTGRVKTDSYLFDNILIDVIVVHFINFLFLNIVLSYQIKCMQLVFLSCLLHHFPPLHSS